MSQSTCEDDTKISKLGIRNQDQFQYHITFNIQKGKYMEIQVEETPYNPTMLSSGNIVSRFRRVVHAIVAAKRFRYFASLKSKQAIIPIVTRQNINNFRYTANEFTERWAKVVYIKAITYSKNIYDFFDKEDLKKADNARLQAGKASLFLFQNLALFTQKEYLPDCLKQLIIMQSHPQTRTLNNYFTNLRIRPISDNMSREEKQLIAAEVIIMEVLVTHLIQCHADVFIKRILISILQIIYLNEFQKMPHKNKPMGQQTRLTANLLIESKSERNPHDVQLEGVYSLKSLELMISSTCNLEQKLTNYFNEILDNLVRL